MIHPHTLQQLNKQYNEMNKLESIEKVRSKMLKSFFITLSIMRWVAFSWYGSHPFVKDLIAKSFRKEEKHSCLDLCCLCLDYFHSVKQEKHLMMHKRIEWAQNTCFTVVSMSNLWNFECRERKGNFHSWKFHVHVLVTTATCFSMLFLIRRLSRFSQLENFFLSISLGFRQRRYHEEPQARTKVEFPHQSHIHIGLRSSSLPWGCLR